MKMIPGIVIVVVLVLVVGFWFAFFKAKPLPSAEEIKRIDVYYNKTFGDSESDYDDPKEFDVTDRSDIRKLRELIGDMPISKMPLLNSDDMDSGKNWMINIQLRDDSMLYISVDKNQVNGNIIDSSKLYKYLRDNYT